MATEKRYLALDMGAESGRGVVGSLADGKLTLEEVHRFGNGPTTVDGSLHWDVQNQAAELRNAIAAAHAKCGAIESVGVDTWGVDYGLLDEAGELLGDPYHYRDSRTDGAEAVAFEIMPRADIYGLTGIQFMQLNTLFQLFAESRADAEKLARAKDLLFMPDLFNYLLTGEKATEYSIATTSQLLDARTGQWSAPLFERLGLPIDIMQQIVPTGTQVGQLLESIAEETGAGRLPVIAPATHDTGSAVAAVPAAAGGENWAYLSSGTWSLMGVELDSPIITPETLELSITNEGGVNNTIRFLKNIMGLWLVQECRRQWEQDGQAYNYDQITQYAAESPAFLSFVKPNDASFASIGHMPGRIQAFCKKSGQKIPDTHLVDQTEPQLSAQRRAKEDPTPTLLL